MELDGTVEIAVCAGGYVVRADVWDASEGEGIIRTHVCLSIDEVLARVRESLESQDWLPESEYREIGRAKK